MLPWSRSTRARGAGSPRPAAPIWVVVALAGWAGVAALGVQLYAFHPPRAGFDLELLLGAGRRVAAGASPYDAGILAGHAPTAVDLFYSYPPPVAQYLSLFAGVPSPVMLVLWGIAAALGVLVAAVALGRLGNGGRSSSVGRVLRSVGLPVVAVSPFLFPLAIAMLFGNLDALFPLLYGLMLVGALAPTLAARFGGGAALAIAGVSKLHPASMGLWFLVRGLRDRRRTSRRTGAAREPAAWVVLGAAAAVGLAILVLSLAAGGVAPWLDYFTVLRSSSAAEVVDQRNIGPAAQIALVIGGGESLARMLQVVVTIGALVGTAAAAWYRDDTVESFAWATLASLIVLPVTWFHYPVALIPIALVAWLRSNPAVRGRLAALLGGAIVIGVLAVASPVLVWFSVALVMVAVRRSLPAGGSRVRVAAPEPSPGSRLEVAGARRQIP